MAEIAGGAVQEWRGRSRAPHRKRIVLFVAVLALAVAVGVATPFVSLSREIRVQRKWAVRDAEIRVELHKVSDALQRFAGSHGRYPARLKELLSADDHDVASLTDAELLDPWGRPYAFTPADTTRFLGSFGSDGMPGGFGDALDIFVEDPVFRQLRNLE